MIPKDMSFFLKTNLPEVTLHTTVRQALAISTAQRLTHLPVTQNETWIGNINVEDLYTLKEEDILENLKHSMEYFFTSNNTNWFGTWELFIQNDTNILPVLNTERKLTGIYTKTDFSEIWSDQPIFTEKGTSVFLQKNNIHYSFSEICQIVETNNAKVLGIFIYKFDNDKANILLKTNSINTQDIINALRRHEYEILSEHPEDEHYNQLKARSEYLNKYLNI